MSESVVEDPILRQRYSFSRSTDEDGGEVLHVDTWIEPGGGVTPHVHPAMEERFHVLEGSAEFLSGRRWSAAGPGEEAVGPAGEGGRAGRGGGAGLAARPPPRLPQPWRGRGARGVRRPPALVAARVP